MIVHLALLLTALLSPSVAQAQAPASRVLFRVFLSDGRVLASYGEWARVDDRVIFSIPTRLTAAPVELHRVNIPSGRVDWRRTEQYTESVHAAVYANTRGEADFTKFSSELATVDAQATGASDSRNARKERKKREQFFRKYRRSMHGSFNFFSDATVSLDQIKTMSGPPLHTIEPLARRLAAAAIRIGKVTPPTELVNSHALVRSAWGLAETALRLRAESVRANNVDTAQRGRTDLTAAMAPPTPK